MFSHYLKNLLIIFLRVGKGQITYPTIKGLNLTPENELHDHTVLEFFYLNMF